MNIKDYEFNIGDIVITTEGETGKIVDICKCERCEARGFYEPIWIDDCEDLKHYITNYQAERNFRGYYQIGKYRFNDFDKDEVLRNIEFHEAKLNQWEKQLKFIEDITTGKTNKDYFFEVFPNAPKTNGNYPVLCVRNAGLKQAGERCKSNCSDCWDELYKGE